MAENTFLGLQPYTEADAYRFKGRAEESQELFRLITRNDYTVCYAESGEGKTSLLNAGVFPLLRENMYFPVAITFTSDDYARTPDSFDAIIERCIKDNIAGYNESNKGINVEYKLCSTDFRGLDCEADLQQALGRFSWWKLRNYRPQAMGLTFTPVFVFDQFEEVFNLPGSIVWTKKFFDWLEGVSSDSCPDEIIETVREIIGPDAAFPVIKEDKGFKAVFSLRKEFMGELDYWGMQKCFIPSLKDNRYCLKALTYEGARKVMTQQQSFDETKVEQVLRYFVEQYSREPEKTISENLPAIPALLLSVVCGSWEKDIDFFSGKGDNEIGQSLHTILERFYDEALSSIAADLARLGGDSQTDSVRADIEKAIFALVDSNGKRVRRKSSELSEYDFDVKYKKVLSDNRIIKISKIDGEDYVEIVHDALCPIIAARKELFLAAEAKRQEERKLREQIKKNRMRMMVFSGILLLALAILFFFFQQNRHILENQSRFVAEKANALVEEGDSYLAQRLLLEVLPENVNNPFGKPITAEAEDALRRAVSQNNADLKGHTDRVNSAFFSPDGKRIVSASDDETVRIWDAKTGTQMGMPLEGHTHRVLSASFSPDGRRIVSASSDETVRIWDAETGEQIGLPLEGHTTVVNSAFFSPDGKRIVSASNDNTVRIWDAETGKQIGEPLEGHTFWVESAFFSPDGKRIVSASWDKTVRIWNVETEMPLEGHTDVVNSAFFSPDGKRIASASADGTVRIWDAGTGKQIGKPFEGHTDEVYSASFSPDGRRIVSASSDETVRIWDAETGEQIGLPLEGHIDKVNSASFSPDGKRIVSASDDGTFIIWDAETGKLIVQLFGEYIGDVNFAFFSPDGKRIVSASDDGTFIIGDAETGKLIVQLFGESVGDVNSAFFSPDGKRIVSASSYGKIRIWDVETGKQIGQPLEGHASDVYSAAFSPDGKRIVSASRDKTVRIWDAKTGKQIGMLDVSLYPAYSAFFSPDGKRIVTALWDNTVRIWDAETGKQIGMPLRGHIDLVHSASFSPDGKRIVSASRDCTVRIWEYPTLQEIINQVRERFKDVPLTEEERRQYYID